MRKSLPAPGHSGELLCDLLMLMGCETPRTSKTHATGLRASDE
jgi:hypothetical protein